MTDSGLIVETTLPFSWQPGGLTPAQLHGSRLLLRVVNLLDAHDAEQDKTSERLEAKLDLMLHWLGYQLFGDGEGLQTTRLKLGHDSVKWESSSTIEAGDTGIIALGIHPAVPGPLRLLGRVVESAGGTVRAEPVFSDESLEEAWNQWLFRLHRRAIQEARLKSAQD
jgi:hypothetical protein